MTEPELPAFRVLISPEDAARVQAHIGEIAAAWRRFAEAMLPLLEAHLADLARVLNAAADLAERARPDDRPAHQSPYGPAHQKRARR